MLNADRARRTFTFDEDADDEDTDAEDADAEDADAEDATEVASSLLFILARHSALLLSAASSFFLRKRPKLASLACFLCSLASSLSLSLSSCSTDFT